MLERFLVPKEDQVLIDSESMTAATKEIFMKMFYQKMIHNYQLKS